MNAAPIAAVASQTPTSKAALEQPMTMPRYTIASPHRSKVLSRNAPSLLVVPVTRATAPSNMSKAEPAVAMMPPSSHHSMAAKSAPTMQMPAPGRAFVAIREHTTLDASEPLRRGNFSHVLASPAAMAARFEDHPDAVRESLALSDRLRFDLTSDLGYRYPGAEDADAPAPERQESPESPDD